MRYEWAHLNKLQKGSYGVHFAKMEFAMRGFLVFTSDVDDRGIDFVVRNDNGKHFDIQVKAITDKNYTYIKQSKFAPSLWVTLIVLKARLEPRLYLLNRPDWDVNKTGLLKLNKYPGAKEAEYGIFLADKRQEELEGFAFHKRIEALVAAK